MPAQSSCVRQKLTSEVWQRATVQYGAKVVKIPMRSYGSEIIGGCTVAEGKYLLSGDSDGSYDLPSSTFLFRNCTQELILSLTADSRGELFQVPRLPVEDSFRPKTAMLASIALCVIFLGVALRFYALGYYPSGFGGHALGHTSMSIKFLETFYPALFSLNYAGIKASLAPILNQQHGPQAFLESIGFFVNGVGLPQAYANAAFVGSLTLVAGFFATRTMFGWRCAMVFMTLLAVSWWHLKISRHGEIEHVLSPFHFLLTIWGVHAASSSKRLVTAAIAGALCGLSIYVYATNQILLVVCPIFLFCTAALWDKGGVRKFLPLMVFLLCAVGTSYPQISFYFANAHYVPLRSSYGTNTYYFMELSAIPAQLKLAIGQLFVQVDDPWFNKPGGGLSVLEAILLLPGAALFFRDLRIPERRRAGLLCVMLLLASPLPGLLGFGSPFRRFLLFVLMSNLCAARAIEWIYVRATPLIKPRQFGTCLPTILSLLYIIYAIHFYFTLAPNFESGSSNPQTEIARFVGTRLGEQTFFLLYPSTEPHLKEHLALYVNIAAYETLRQFARRGISEDRLFRILDENGLRFLAEKPKEIPAQFQLLVPSNNVRLVEQLRTSSKPFRAIIDSSVRHDHKDTSDRLIFSSWDWVRPPDNLRLSQKLTPKVWQKTTN